MTSRIKVLALGVVLLAASGGASLAENRDADVRIGSYKGTWCGYPAIISIESKEKKKWVFHGSLIFPTYNNLSDELWVEQYGDDSLRMIRYLSGTQQGLTQVVQTKIPVMYNIGGVQTPHFTVERADGPDCEGKPTGFYLIH